MKVDFKQINENIVKQGLNPEYISIIYENLTPREAKEIYLKQGIHGLASFERNEFDEEIKTGKGEKIEAFLKRHNRRIVAGYPKDFRPLYPEKATRVLTLES